MARVVVLGLVLVFSQVVLVSQPRADLLERIRGAEHVVVGVVTDVTPVLQENEFGDQLIVSRTTVAVEETLKGPTNLTTVEIEVEGGTIDGLSLAVSDVEPVVFGDRGVFMLMRIGQGNYVPHLRGQGLLTLDASEQVRGEPWSLADVRAAARAVAASPQ